MKKHITCVVRDSCLGGIHPLVWIVGPALAMLLAATTLPRQAAAQASGTPPVGSSGSQPQGTADPVQQYLQNLGKVMDDLGCRQTYYPPMVEETVDLPSGIEKRSPSRRTRLVPGPANRIRRDIPLSEVIAAYWAEKRLEIKQIGNDGSVFGEYDHKKRVITLNSYHQVHLPDALTRATSRKSSSESRTRSYLQVFQAIQTFNHELVHLAQNEHEMVIPFDPLPEARAYRSSLDMAQQWVNSLHERLEKEPTLDLAHRLQAACDAWKAYRNDIADAMRTSSSPPDKSALDGPFRDSSGKGLTLKELEDQINKIQQRAAEIETVIRVLGSLQGQGGAYGPQADDIVGWDQLRDRLDHAGSLNSKAELEAFLKNAAKNSKLGFQNRSPDEIYADSKAAVEKLWREKKRTGFPGMLIQLGKHPPQIDWQLDPTDGFRAGAQKVTVMLRTTDPLPQAIEKIRRLAEEIFDPPDRPQLLVKDTWTSPDGNDETEDWTTDPPKRKYEFDKPGKYSATLQRSIVVGGKEIAGYPALSVSFSIPGTVPDTLGGRWSGALVIKQVKINVKPEDEFGKAIIEALKRLEGDTFAMAIDCRPADQVSGSAIVEFSWQTKGQGGKVDQHRGQHTIPYTITGNKLSSQVTQPGATASLSGTFSFVNNVWSIQGEGDIVIYDPREPKQHVRIPFSWRVSQQGP